MSAEGFLIARQAAGLSRHTLKFYRQLLNSNRQKLVLPMVAHSDGTATPVQEETLARAHEGLAFCKRQALRARYLGPGPHTSPLPVSKNAPRPNDRPRWLIEHAPDFARTADQHHGSVGAVGMFKNVSATWGSKCVPDCERICSRVFS